MKARFLLSTLDQFPTLKDSKGRPLPEIVIAGRSNVGKSTLINHLFEQKKLAKTSATPGKTQLLNFFVVDERFILVDLPGYGFAKAPPEEIAKWSMAIETYIHAHKPKLFLLLVDCRREFSSEDESLIHWAKANDIPLVLILTKTDKLNASEKLRVCKQHPEAIPYTVMTPSSRGQLKKRIEEVLWD